MLRAHAAGRGFLRVGTPTNRGEHAAAPDNGPGAFLDLAADAVQHHVHTGHRLFETGRVVVHYPVHAQFPQERLVARRRRADHVRALPLGQLGRDVAYAARRRVNQHRLAGLEVRHVEQRLPRGQGRQRQPGGLRIVHRIRLGHEVHRRRGHVFGVAAASPGPAHHATDRVAGPEVGDIRAQRLNHARYVPPRNERERVMQPRRYALARARLPVHRVDARGAYPHQHLPGLGLRPRRFIDPQAVEPAKLVYPYGFHAISVAHGAALCQREGVGVASLPGRTAVADRQDAL